MWRQGVLLFGVVLLGCMENAKQMPVPRAETLYHRLGGEPGIAKIVDDFVAHVVDDPDIRDVHKKHFMEGDVAGLKRKLIDQIGEASGGPHKYTGKNMKDAHQGLAITNADFDALVNDVAKALDDNGILAQDKKTILDLLETMRADVVEKLD
ncbi:MAG: group I truncated hemoglobin [Gemmataceae bacterium]